MHIVVSLYTNDKRYAIVLHPTSMRIYRYFFNLNDYIFHREVLMSNHVVDLGCSICGCSIRECNLSGVCTRACGVCGDPIRDCRHAGLCRYARYIARVNMAMARRQSAVEHSQQRSRTEQGVWLNAVTREHEVSVENHKPISIVLNDKTITTRNKNSTVLEKVPNINPRKIQGNWIAGWALDVHTLSSRPLPGGGYDTERTEFGEWIFQLKYRRDRTKIQSIAEVAAKFVKEKFAVDGHPILPYLKAILPIPPSDTNRAFQPVTEIAQEIGRLLSVPVRTDYLTKVKRTIPLKNLPDAASKREQLHGAFVVQSQNLKNRCVLLVDDLYDSGTTLTEATKVLYEQGSVQHVLVLTLTRTRTGGN